MQKQGKNHWSRETTVQGPHSPSRDTHIFELFWRHWSDSVLSASTQNPGWLELEGWWCWLSLTSTPPIRRLPTSWSCALWTIAINLLTKYFQVGTNSFEGMSLLFPFAWKSNKAVLFYLTQNSASEIKFGTGAQRLSFQHRWFII